MFIILVFSFSLVIATCSAMFAFLNGVPGYLLFTVIGASVALFTFLKIRELFEVAQRNIEMNYEYDNLTDQSANGESAQQGRIVQSTKRDVDETARIRRPSLVSKGIVRALKPKSKDQKDPGDKEKGKEVKRRIKPRKSKISELYIDDKPSTDFIFAAMCHEVRTPLNGVVGMIELLLDTKLTRKQRSLTQTVFNSSQVLSQVVNDYVLYFRTQAGEEVEGTTGKCNIEETVLQVALLFQGLAYAKKLDLVVDIGPDVPRSIECDPRRLQQVIGNLTLNAIKYTKEGEVCIGVRVLEDRSKLLATSKEEAFMLDKLIPLEIYVADSGPGLNEQEVKDLFIPFRRLKSAESTTGSGIGLTICKLIADSMHASIDVESEVGLGTTFSFYFQPLVLSSEQPDYSEFKGKKVCVYGGEMGSRMTLLTYLEEIGFEVREGQEGELEVFDAKEQVMAGVDLVFAFVDSLGEMAANFYERSKSAVCRVRWLSDPKAFECEFEYTLIRPFSRATVIEILNDFYTSSGRHSTVDRWRSTFAERFPLKIVVAEDDTVSMGVIVGILERLGYHPETARDGEEAVRLVKQLHPDVAIIDMHMPGCTGLKVIEKCRESHTWWIVASAGSSILTKENAHIYGYNDLLSKPLSIDAVRNALQRAGESIVFHVNEGESEGGGYAPLPEMTSDAEVSVSPDESPHDQMRRLYANDPNQLAELIAEQIEQTDEFLREMVNKADDPLAEEDVRRMAHTLRSSSSFAGATETAAIAKRIDKEWEVLTLAERKILIHSLRDIWFSRERHQLVDEVNEIKRNNTQQQTE